MHGFLGEGGGGCGYMGMVGLLVCAGKCGYGGWGGVGPGVDCNACHHSNGEAFPIPQQRHYPKALYFYFKGDQGDSRFMTSRFPC